MSPKQLLAPLLIVICCLAGFAGVYVGVTYVAPLQTSHTTTPPETKPPTEYNLPTDAPTTPTPTTNTSPQPTPQPTASPTSAPTTNPTPTPTTGSNLKPSTTPPPTDLTINYTVRYENYTNGIYDAKQLTYIVTAIFEGGEPITINYADFSISASYSRRSTNIGYVNLEPTNSGSFTLSPENPTHSFQLEFSPGDVVFEGVEWLTLSVSHYLSYAGSPADIIWLQYFIEPAFKFTTPQTSITLTYNMASTDHYNHKRYFVTATYNHGEHITINHADFCVIIMAFWETTPNVDGAKFWPTNSGNFTLSPENPTHSFQLDFYFDDDVFIYGTSAFPFNALCYVEPNGDIWKIAYS
jgi:hypothetical protein